ncbi:hypothetical protein LguiA_000994 [Lonicera macranthoides]
MDTIYGGVPGLLASLFANDNATFVALVPTSIATSSTDITSVLSLRKGMIVAMHRSG